MDFDMLGLQPRLIARLDEMGIKDPTPIQKQAIPEAMNGRDIMGLAQTGTGKTAAFGLPMLHNLITAGSKPAPKTTRGLILAPTRELAKQIHDNLRSFTEGSHIKINLVVGGASLNAQANRLARGTDLLVATPGRLLDLLDRKAIRLDEAQYLVLDEADQMLDLGFIVPLRKIAALLPAKRQTMLFSATMPKQMNELASAYLENPVRIEVSPPGKTADKITQGVHFLSGPEKTPLLIELLDKHREELAIVFARTKRGSERLMKSLVGAGYAADSVHGNKSQGQRERAIKGFREGKVKILVATDVAARGLDIPDVRYVYNYDLPNVPDSYVHRIGRTARAGRDGTAIAFCAPDEMKQLRDVQKTIGREIPVLSGAPFKGAFEQEPKKRGGGGGNGQRRRFGGSGGGGGGAKGGAPKTGGGRPGAKRRPRRAA